MQGWPRHEPEPDAPEGDRRHARRRRGARPAPGPSRELANWSKTLKLVILHENRIQSRRSQL